VNELQRELKDIGLECDECNKRCGY